MIEEQPVASPCIRSCCLDTQDICLGCFRSLEEIKQWSQADNKTRQQFLNNAKERAQDYQNNHAQNIWNTKN